MNFCVTEEGLEEQLLAAVVDHERADLQEAAAALVAQLGQYTITLTELENNLLARLANSQVRVSLHALAPIFMEVPSHDCLVF